VANLKQWHPLRGGQPNDLDDWVAILAEFQGGATGVLESSKLASGRNESWRSLDYVEVNGSERSFVFITGEWNKLQTGNVGGPGLETIEVPRELWKTHGSPREVGKGDPLVTFRYDQAWEFVDAIRKGRPCVPSFHDGARVQRIVDAALKSTETRQWIELDNASA
jgi:predicted dehydrogenase